MKIHIPDTVRSVETKAFYNWNLVGMQTIYCEPGTVAYDFAVVNDFKIEIE
jgi:hypothetical protein